MSKQHTPVLSAEVWHYLNPSAEEHYLDLTAGYGGHARGVLDRLGPRASATLVDRDPSAIAELQKQFKGDKRVEIVQADFLSVSRRLHQAGQKFDLILADIGLSSPHIDNASRGFSFQNDGPLDMRMDQTQKLTAQIIVNTWEETDLSELLRIYGEVRRASRVARKIVEARPIKTTKELASVIKGTGGHGSYGKNKSFEAQVFQALRIAVNDELSQLKESLPLWKEMLKPKGRLAVISFHSLEDRIVKQFLKEHGGGNYDAEFELLTKKPITSTPEERSLNPRARSAKLRVAQRK